jgi:hypothetical protein
MSPTPDPNETIHPESIAVPIDESGDLLISGDRRAVVFLLPRGRVRVQLRDGALIISGSDGITIGPRTTNSIDIHVGVR